MHNILLEEMKAEDHSEASEVLGKAWATLPAAIAILRNKTDIERRMRMVWRATLKYLPGYVYVAKQDGVIAGVMRMVKWPDCQMKPMQALKTLPTMLKIGGLGDIRRMMEFRGRWAKADPKEPHWHLDPIGVRPDLQGKGIGSQMMEFYCSRVDSTGMPAYHETDRPENVKFYERFGFKVTKEEIILGFKSWYMWRSSKPKA
jgi:ribosomal protein S18 acetylase RimI-like enzyme